MDPRPRRTQGPQLVVYHLHVHLAFTTKYRRDALTDPILTRCQQVIADLCADFGAQLREFNGKDDHAHLLVHYPPAVALSKLVNSVKNVSARNLRQEFSSHLSRYLWNRDLWSPSNFAGSCGDAPLDMVKEYIENQKWSGP